VVNSEFAFGIDISRYNTSPDGRIQVDFDVIAAHAQHSSSESEVVFIAMRTGVSWGYQDPWFATYFEEAGNQRKGRWIISCAFWAGLT